MYAFTRAHGEPPSIVTLHQVFKDKDEEAYNLRYREVLDSITAEIPDRSTILYVLDQARDTGVVRDFQELANDQTFLKKQADLKGSSVLKALHTFFNRHGDVGQDRTMDLREAIENLVQTAGFMPEVTRIPTGIEVIDAWSGGGLRTKQLGIIMAPTGAGKSSVLIVMGHKMAELEQKRVWIVTNELTIEEETERLLSRITGTDLTEVINDPGIAYKGLERHWKAGLHDRIRITEINREVSVDDIESEMMKWVNLIGWKPDVLILDFMERMKPCDAGYARDKEWNWLGAISRDLSRFAKRHNILVWTAAQTNRSGMMKGATMGLEMAQASTKHLQEATVVIGMNQHEVGEDKIAMEFSSLKQRHSRGSFRPVMLECDLSKMSITNTVYETDTYEDTSTPEVAPSRALTPREKQERAQRRKAAQ
jgi:replicative DNA helicase